MEIFLQKHLQPTAVQGYSNYRLKTNAKQSVSILLDLSLSKHSDTKKGGALRSQRHTHNGFIWTLK